MSRAGRLSLASIVVGALVGLWSAASSAAPTSSDILQTAQSGLGFSYYWGHARWGTGDPVGSCSGNCPSCTHTGQDGADCSGYVSKAWQLDGTPTTTDTHPYATADFVNANSLWTQIADRSQAQPGDAFVYHSGSHGHIVLYVSGDASGSVATYQATGCKKGIVSTSMTLGSAYQLIRLAGVETDAGADSGPDGGAACTANGEPGTCISTTQCSTMSGFMSVPGFCPGPTNIQCCVTSGDGGEEGGSSDDAGPVATDDGGGAGGASVCTYDDQCTGSTPYCCDPDDTGTPHCSATQCATKPATSALPVCSSNGDCKNGESCCDNDSDGQSHCTAQACATGSPVTNQCASSSDCPQGQICDPNSAACVSNDGGSCTDDSQCPSGEQCDGGTCSSGQLGSSCTASSDCGSGLSCDPTCNQCSTGNTSGCTDSSSCAGNQACDVSSGQCVSAPPPVGCQSDSDCPSGETCDTTQSACVPTVVCEPGTTLSGGQCVPDSSDASMGDDSSTGSPDATCADDGASCSVDGDCCSGTCSGNVCGADGGVPDESGPTCGADGTSCSADSDCCSGSCGTCDNTCSGASGGADGATCSMNSDCCSGTCGTCDDTCGGTSGGQPGDACTNDTDCCSGTCDMSSDTCD